MTSNQRDAEQVQADKTVEALENEKQNATTQDDRETQLLGRALRQAANIDLPEVNPELRGLIISQLEFQNLTATSTPANVVAPTKPVKILNRSRAGWWIAIAATGLLAVGSWISYQSFMETNLANREFDSDGSPNVGDLMLPGSPSGQVTGPQKQSSQGSQSVMLSKEQPSSALTSKPHQLDLFSEKMSEELADTKQATNAIANGQAPAVNFVAPGQQSAPNVGFGINGMLADNLALQYGESKDSYGVQGPRNDQFSYSLGVLRDDSWSMPGQEVTQLNRMQFGMNGDGLGSTVDGLGGGGFGGGGGGFGKGFESTFGRNPHRRDQNTEQYDQIKENSFVRVFGESAKSTFSIDVDTASYTNMRRFINAGQLPPRNSIRIEEMINYFNYNYAPPQGDDPFAVNMEVASCPWNDGHKLLRIGIKGKEIHREERPASNIVFLLDVSGSMNSHDKLPLLKRGVQMMVERLNENDLVSIVTYAGNAGLVLAPTGGDQTQVINQAIEKLQPGGSTNGSAGIEMAYELAQKNFIQDGTNRVILATDGDLNVGVTSDSDLVELIKNKASEGVFLTVLGFGTGNLKDSKMEKLADNGNGIYAYIDSIREANKVLVQQMSASLVTIAKDVKLQLEFNPAEILAYRLIGYENRVMANKDFANDMKDAGEIGAGHTVTALYELVPAKQDKANLDIVVPAGLKYQKASPQEIRQDNLNLTDAANSGELLTVFLRHKKPDGNESKLTEYTVKDNDQSFESASSDFRFAASVASFGMLLRGSKFAGSATPETVLDDASGSIGDDTSGYRAEFVDLARRVGKLAHGER